MLLVPMGRDSENCSDLLNVFLCVVRPRYKYLAGTRWWLACKQRVRDHVVSLRCKNKRDVLLFSVMGLSSLVLCRSLVKIFMNGMHNDYFGRGSVQSTMAWTCWKRIGQSTTSLPSATRSCIATWQMIEPCALVEKFAFVPAPMATPPLIGYRAGIE